MDVSQSSALAQMDFCMPEQGHYTTEELMEGMCLRRRTDDSQTALNRYDSGYLTKVGPADCNSD